MLSGSGQATCWTAIRRVVMIIFTMLWTVPLSAKDIPIKVGRMTLSFKADEKFIPKAFRERLEQDWERFCEDFAVNFQVGKGPQGRGIFSRVECKSLDYVKDVDTIEAIENPWHFVFHWKSEGFGVDIYFQPKGKKTEPTLIRSIEFPKQLTPDFLFAFPQPKYYVVNKIYRNLPVGWTAVFNKADIQWQLNPLQPEMLSVMTPPRKVGLYSMAYNLEQKIWVPTLYAVAQPVVADDSSKDFDREGGGPLELRWVVTPKQTKLRLWAQEIYNPLEKEVDPPFLTMREGQSGQSILEGYALEGLKSNSVSVRYGVPFPKGTTVVSQASKVEVVATIGKGMLDGLVVGVEFSPRLEVKEAGETYSYTWTRMEAGWSFILGEPQTIDRFATRFKLTPKIGVLSLDAYFPLNASENLEFATVAEFKLSRQIDLGGEFSWELESLSYRLKAWASTHLSGYVLAQSNPTKISNQRAGADLSYDLFKTRGGLRVGAMVFGYIDWVTLQKEAAPQLSLNLATSTTASGASYNVTYLGAGFSVTW